jgi:hypothetical protein
MCLKTYSEVLYFLLSVVWNLEIYIKKLWISQVVQLSSQVVTEDSQAPLWEQGMTTSDEDLWGEIMGNIIGSNGKNDIEPTISVQELSPRMSCHQIL